MCLLFRVCTVPCPKPATVLGPLGVTLTQMTVLLCLGACFLLAMKVAHRNRTLVHAELEHQHPDFPD